MKTFHQIVLNSAIATFASFTVWFALTYYVYLETQSVFATSIIAGIFLVNGTISSFWFGTLVDKYKKKNVMLASSIITLIIFILGFILYINTDPNTFKDITSPTLWFFIVLLLVGVIVSNIRGIALPTLVTMLVPQKEHDKANGLVGMVSGLSFLLVSVASGFLVGFGGMYWALLISIAIGFLTIVHLWFLEIPGDKVGGSAEEPVKTDLKGTFNVIKSVPGLLALIFFTTINNLLGGVFMSLMDPYGLSLVSVQVWGLLWGVISLGFIIGGTLIAKFGLGKNPLRSLFIANIIIWIVSIFLTIYPSIILLSIGMFIYISVIPYIEAAEHTIIQKVVPAERQGRVFGFAHSVETAASPITAFAIGPITQFIFIPFMTTGAGVQLIGNWFGTGPDRGMALVFTITGIIGLIITILAMRSKYYKQLSVAASKESKEDVSQH